MANNTTVGAQVQVEFSSVGQMRKAIKEATSDLIAMQEQFGKTSPQAIAAAKRIAELKDRIQDAKEQADLFDPGKRFSAFANAANQVAAGFSAVQGAMALVGTESEDLQKTLVKVQGAVALSQGLSQLKDLGKAYDEIKIVAVDAFKSIKAAIGSTGIGLLVVALGAIVAYWDDIKAAVSGVSSEQKKLNEDSAKNVKTQQEKLDAINAQDNILKMQGKSEREILQLKVKQTDEIIKASEIQLQNTITTTKAQVETAQRNKDILQGFLTMVTAPLAVVLKGIDAIGSALGKNFNLYDKFYGGISSLVFDPKQAQEEGNKVIKEQEKALTELKNNRAGLQLQLTELDKKDADKQLEAQKKLIEEKKNFEKEYTAFLIAEKERRAKLRMDDFDKERFDINKKYDDLIAKAKKYGLDTSEIEGLRFQETKDLVNKNTEVNKEGLDKQLSNFGEMVPKMATMQTTLTVNQATEAGNRKVINDMEVQSREETAAKISNIMDGISNVFGRETAAGKATAIAAATINTYLAASQALTGIKKMNPFGAAMAIAQAALVVINGLKQVKAIASVQVPKGGGGGGFAPSASIAGGGAAPIAAEATPAVISQAVTAQAVNNLGNQAMRAYVLNSDITNNDQRNAYLQRNARLG